MVARIGEQAPGFEQGTFFEEVSAPAVTQDGQRVAFMAKLTGNQKSWWFGDLQPDGYYDLKVAAKTGMEVNGSPGTLILDWFPDPNTFGNERPAYASRIHLDPVTGKLAFLGYLANTGTEKRALLIADDNGVNLVMLEGLYPEYGYTFLDDFIPFAVAFSEIKYINDVLAFSSRGVNPDYFAQHFSVFVYREGRLNPLLLAPELFPSYVEPQYGEVSVERLGPIAVNRNGVVAFIVDGRIPSPGVNNNQQMSLVLGTWPGGILHTIAAKWDIAEGFPFPARMANFSELSINRNDEVLVTAQCFEVDEAGVPKDFEIFENTGVFLLEPSGFFPADPMRQSFSSVDLGAGGSKTVLELKNAQTAGNYVSYTAIFSGGPNVFPVNIGLFRHNYADGVEELVFYAGGPSNIDGLGTVYGIDHVYLGPYGDIIAQITTDDGFRRSLVHVAPPDDDDIVRYRVLADSYSFLNFDCEFGCDGFTPFLPNLYFPSTLSNPGKAYGPEAGDTPWINDYEASWLINTSLFGVDRSEYSVLLDLDPILVDYGDAPHKELTPAPIDVPTGYVEASHVINEEMFLGKRLDPGVREKDANLRNRYFGLDDDIQGVRNAGDDDDGVVFDGTQQAFSVNSRGRTLNLSYPSILLGESVSGTIYASTPADQAAYIDAWIDFNRNGTFDPAEQIIVSQRVDAGTSDKAYPFEILPEQFPTIEVGYTFARFRLSGGPNILPKGNEDSGEVEDYLIYFGVAMDYGDAPQEGVDSPYPTRLINNGARHTSLINTPILGQAVDYEIDGAPSLLADGDDTSGSDDEDGIVFPPVMLPGQTVDLLATASMPGKLDGWIDYNQDGDWNDEGEQILESVDVIEGENSLPVSLPGDIGLGSYYARFRISLSGGLLPTGLAQGGEVEDYRIELKFPPIGWDFLNPGQSQARLFWEGAAALEGSPGPFGPWSPLESVSGEYLHALGGDNRFFRLVPETP